MPLLTVMSSLLQVTASSLDQSLASCYVNSAREKCPPMTFHLSGSDASRQSLNQLCRGRTGCSGWSINGTSKKLRKEIEGCDQTGWLESNKYRLLLGFFANGFGEGSLCFRLENREKKCYKDIELFFSLRWSECSKKHLICWTETHRSCKQYTKCFKTIGVH